MRGYFLLTLDTDQHRPNDPAEEIRLIERIESLTGDEGEIRMILQGLEGKAR